MKIVIPGGTGQVGTILARAFHGAGHEVVVLSRLSRLSRSPVRAPWRVGRWDARNVGDWAAELEGADAVVNLAGRSVNCRYDGANRREIMESRVESTRAVGEAIARAARPPRVWLQMSTATIYAHRYDAPNDEATGVIGGAEESAPDTWRFSIDVTKAWERAAEEAATPQTRKVLMRAAMVMSPDRGGVFDTLLALARRGLGGRAGSGRQYVSWIHEADFTRAVRWLIDRDDLSGAINLASPRPLPNADFMRELRRAWGARLGLPASEWMLAVGALLLRTETELILKSRRVVPTRLLASGFAFDFPAWSDAARDLCRRWRETKTLSRNHR
ncbi:MAG: TIGR01777 family oxidoreductase [Acidobacteria bacterium]|nr:TIGR01777 family oxidoreductase [Acidobacteriota bacterium]